MPEKITKRGRCYSVSTPNRQTAKCTTKQKAKAQARLLRAKEHGWKPSHRKLIDSIVKG